MTEIALTQVAGPDLVATARELFREYALAIGTDLEYQGFSAELAALPAPYVPPDGALLIARVGDDVAGCVGLRPFDSETGEMKRLYVRPAYRALGLGKRLVLAVIDAARQRGYRELRLDTLASMTSAQALYERLGFAEIPPYADRYLPGTRFYALDLRFWHAAARGDPDHGVTGMARRAANPIRVRKLGAAEWPLYRALRLEALRDAPDAFGSTLEREEAFPDAEWMGRLARAATSAADCPLVAEMSGRPVGLAWARLDPNDASVATLYQVWVNPAARGRGGGRALLDAAMAWARDAGARVMQLCVALGPTSAFGFYERGGFEPVGEPSALRPGSALLQQDMRCAL